MGEMHAGDKQGSPSSDWSQTQEASRRGGVLESQILACADDTTLMAESEEELTSLLMKVKEETEKSGLNSTFEKQRSWHLVPSLHGK